MQLLKSQVSSLPKRYQNAYEKRRDENLLMMERRYNESLEAYQKRRVVEAEDEALQHVARLVYLAEQRKKNKAAQGFLFNVEKPGNRRGVADAGIGGDK